MLMKTFLFFFLSTSFVYCQTPKSWDDEKIQKNLDAIMAVAPRSKIISVSLCATMGPAVKIKI